MERLPSTPKVAHTFWPVKSNEPSWLTPPPDSVIHHKNHTSISNIIHKSKGKRVSCSYGVSRSYRVLSPQLLLKKFDSVRDFLQYTLGLTTAERAVTLRLLRLWAYYGKVYPKESQISEYPGCSKATYWRTIKYLRELGLVHVVNRYLIRPHAQISNLYRLDRLVLVIARYLAEHGVHFGEKWLTPYLQLPGRVFWRSWARGQESRAGPSLSGVLPCDT